MATIVWVGIFAVLSFPIWGWFLKNMALKRLPAGWNTSVAGTLLFWIINLITLDCLVAFVFLTVSGKEGPLGPALLQNWNWFWTWVRWILGAMVLGNVILFGRVAGDIKKRAYDDYVDMTMTIYGVTGCCILISGAFYIFLSVANAMSGMTIIPPQ